MLISTVKKGIVQLESKFNLKYDASQTKKMSQLRDLPPVCAAVVFITAVCSRLSRFLNSSFDIDVQMSENYFQVSGSIIWARQIERHLDIYMQRVEDVLGKRWFHHVEGQRLKAETDQFRSRLQPTAIFAAWLADAQKLGDFEVEARIFRLVNNKKNVELLVNFDRQMVTLFKEVRNLERLGLKVPYEIKIAANEAREVYPFAMRLEETLRLYQHTCARMEAFPDMQQLISGLKKNVQGLISKGLQFRWHFDSKKLNQYVDKLSTSVVELQDKVEELLLRHSTVANAMKELAECEPTPQVLMQHVSSIQEVVDAVDKQGFANIRQWVDLLDTRVQEALAIRLKELLAAWSSSLDHSWEAPEQLLASEGANEARVSLLSVIAKHVRRSEGPVRHEIVLRNQVLQVSPPLPHARLQLYQEMQRVVGMVSAVPRLRCFWNGQSVSVAESLPVSYAHALVCEMSSLADGSAASDKQSLLHECYFKIEESISAAQRYTHTWLEYQALWDMDLNAIYRELGDNIGSWERLLHDMKRARAMFDNAETKREFGPIRIDYSSVQVKVVDKYYAIHKEMVSRFALKLGEVSQTLMSSHLTAGRKQLETQNFDYGTTADIVTSVTLLQTLNKQSKQWATQLESIKAAEKLLVQQRFMFPDGWIYADRIQGEWHAFEQILGRRLAHLLSETPLIQVKISAEDRNTETRVKEIMAEWKNSKPVQGDLPYADAISALAVFDSKLTLLEESITRVVQVKRALELPVLSSDEDRLLSVREELNALKEVWHLLAGFWRQLDDLKEKRFSDIKPSDIRKNLNAMSAGLQALPNHVRQYDSYEFLRGVLKSHGTVNVLLVDLGSGILRAKHQKLIMKELRLSGLWAQLTLGQLWEADLKKYEKALKAVLEAAQGESALEEFLNELGSAWEQTRFELAEYKSRCHLVKNWETLLLSLNTHLADLSSMNQSPFFKTFEREAGEWSQRLNKAHAIYDVFIDLQRKWVYLEGVFNNSADIQNQLTFQFNRFRTFDREFIKLMQSIKVSPAVDVWIQDDKNLLVKLETSIETLSTIQKALGEYLQKQRLEFPRFFFVGDEDLLEILGNGKDPVQVNRHLGKMFAGIVALTVDDTALAITGMQSKEGERVAFSQPISYRGEATVHGWLTKVEQQMQATLAILLADATSQGSAMRASTAVWSESQRESEFFSWIDRYPAQIALLAVQVMWSERVESILSLGEAAEAPTLMDEFCAHIQWCLQILADIVLRPLASDARKKYEQLITEFVRQRDVIRSLRHDRISSEKDFTWLSQMRFYFNPGHANLMQKLEIRISRASFHYGFEYLGVGERLVQTPLTDRAFLTLAQAMHARLGGNPFGPAGTGKTETVKALANQLGRFCLVFNCDESFDFQAMGRIFVGLCQCGAWGCFDEFNRLEERILSAISQQILTIQVGLRSGANEITLLGQSSKLDPGMGIFITMNPGYAGRSNLPDNLKSLFRGIAMIHPDRRLISQVMLYSQGFQNAEVLSGKIVLFFSLCTDQLSSQFHYDFGLRALKSVLRSAGALKRSKMLTVSEGESGSGRSVDGVIDEQEILLRSIGATVVPKLVAEDLPLFSNLLSSVFPNSAWHAAQNATLRDEISKACVLHSLCEEKSWIEKLLQLHDILEISHGVIIVGPAGSGKSSAWHTLREGMDKTDGVKTEFHVIDPKALSKDELYGTLDSTTLEWTDGVFTHLLRKIIDSARGERGKRHWIVFDGDVDPEVHNSVRSCAIGPHMVFFFIIGLPIQVEFFLIFSDLIVSSPATLPVSCLFTTLQQWAENLNSVLDDNKILTLPNGERLALTENIRILFEVQDLRFATLATVSRCGMVFFSNQTVSAAMMCRQFLSRMRSHAIKSAQGQLYRDWQSVQDSCATLLEPHFWTSYAGNSPDEAGLVLRALQCAEATKHIMSFTSARALDSMCSLLRGGVAKILEYNEANSDFPLSSAQMDAFLGKYLLVSLCWSFGGSMSLRDRTNFAQQLRAFSSIEFPSGVSARALSSSVDGGDSNDQSLLDYFVRIETGAWEEWSERVGAVEIDTHKVTSPDVVIETVDTVRHTEMLSIWLADHKPLLLCGPPGSGKSMTLTSVLRSLPDCDLVTLNFSATTQPDLILRTLDHYCKCEKTPSGLVMKPASKSRWLVIFCDEINLPLADSYGTQKVITFLRSVSELGGFWRPSDHSFITLERIQLVGACNPPTDAGRVVLSDRFLRHCPLLMVDFPAAASLRQIYGTFNRAMLKMMPSLRSFAEPLTDAMIDVYQASQRRFVPEQHPHYIYSPRELSRWVRGMYEALRSAEQSGVGSLMVPQQLVRLWLHEGLRLFSDRLVTEAEREWMSDEADAVARSRFSPLELSEALARPVLLSNWLSKNYCSVDQNTIRAHIKAKLNLFRDEEMDVKLVVFDEVVEHVLRIDRVLRQPLGHALLVGASGCGKTVLSRFVAWINGMSVFQIKVHKQYSSKDFDKDLRSVLIRAGTKQEKIAFIFDESNALESSFLERMNALLASGEVPGLFEGSDFKNLMIECKEAYRHDSATLGDLTEDDLYRRFCRDVQRNLHTIFTMNPASSDFENRNATSPALFNRCVVDWFGEWSSHALFQVGYEFTRNVDLGDGELQDGVEGREIISLALAAVAGDASAGKAAAGALSPRHAAVASLVFVHQSIHETMRGLTKRGQGNSAHLTPRHYLDFIKHFVTLSGEKRTQLEDLQRHLNSGLRKLVETQQEVSHLQTALNEKRADLEVKNRQANEKLEQMIVDQKRAEQKRDQSIKLADDIAKREVGIAERRAKVSEDLANVEPMLLDAKRSVQNIKRENLDELRALNNPPSSIKLALEAVLLVLGEEVKDWNDVKKALRRPEFIGSILSFDANSLNEKTRQKLKKTYLENADFTFEVVNRASKAAGPMVKWVQSTAIFSDMCSQVEPLNNELKGLESEAQLLIMQQTELTRMVEELQSSIVRYKNEYAILISQTEAIKAQVVSVGGKLERSVALLHNLSSERVRWESESQSFLAQMRTLVGDCILSAAFLAYSGFFNSSYRQSLFHRWQSKLDDMRIPFKAELSFIEYLTHPSDRLAWQAHSLPADDLCVENAIILSRFNRYPLIIDPSGQSTEFLMQQYAAQKIIRTSFLDDAFLRSLESALRFGNALLVEDVESIDPILNSVLNRETHKMGGRVLVRLGDKDVDFSPSFTILLATRDSSCNFAPDLCSRVTFVNFTVTPSSLRSQCLAKILKAERPDIDRKQSDHLKQQGAFRVQLRVLEDSLLTALSGVQTNILEDERVMNTLETLKQQANEVAQKVSESEASMTDAVAVAARYRPFAATCSKIYFSLERLADCHFLYQFSLRSFLDIVDFTLTSAAAAPTSASASASAPSSSSVPLVAGGSRLEHLQAALLRAVYERVTRSLLAEDHVAFAVRLAQIHLEENSEADQVSFDEMDLLLKNRVTGRAAEVAPAVWHTLPIADAQ